MSRTAPALLTAMVTFAPALACQTTDAPVPTPLPSADPLVVPVHAFAMLPEVDGEPARMMDMEWQPDTGRYFVNGMRGPIWSVSPDGASVVEYVDIDAPEWGVGVESGGRERGFQNFAFHPDFGREGAPGFGRFYTWTDTDDTEPEADYGPASAEESHHTVLLEWRALDPSAATYDGGPPRELLRIRQPYGNHNAGDVAFRSVGPDDPEYGLLYVGVADGGSGGDPQNLAQNRASIFGKIIRIDPLGSSGPNGRYGVPDDNPFVGEAGTLGEIWALGLRNPQRFGWDPATGTMYVADIGQNTVEEVSPVPRGGNLGWNRWEGSYRYSGRQGVEASAPRSDPAMTYPVAEWNHGDPLLIGRTASTGVVVQRSTRIPELSGQVLIGDFPSGEIFVFDADEPPEGGTTGLRRVLLDPGSGATSFLEIVRARTEAQGRGPASRTDLRFAAGPDGRVFLLNKHDGTIRELGSGS
ncbi:MAG: PQQ-dependent sugar dehydrogenase [Longimicrobiales bacterium]